MWDLFWTVEENYCVLAYEDINCVGSMDIKEPWNLEEGAFSNRRLLLWWLITTGSLLVPIAGMSSVKVVNVSGNPIAEKNRLVGGLVADYIGSV